MICFLINRDLEFCNIDEKEDLSQLINLKSM